MAVPVTTGVNVSGSEAVSGSQFDIASMVPTILEKFIAVLEAALIVVGGIFAIRYIRARLRKLEVQHDQQRNAINLFEKITSGFIVVVIITMALKIVGIDMTLLVSVAILGLSYGLQDIIKNYVAGILILFKSPFKIGDIIKIRNHTGRISKMDFQATTIDTFDNKHVSIGNSDVMTQAIINFSNKSVRRLNFDVTVGYGSDIPAVLHVFNLILGSQAEILKNPKHSISFKSFTELGPTFTLKFWIKRPCNILKIRTEVATKICQSFDEEKIIFPYNKGIQTENEPDLSKISEERRNRIRAFYSSPFFTAAAQPAAAIATSQPAAGQPPVPGAETGQPAPVQPAEGQPGAAPTVEGQPSIQSQPGVQPLAAGEVMIQMPPATEEEALPEGTEMIDFEEPEA